MKQAQFDQQQVSFTPEDFLHSSVYTIRATNEQNVTVFSSVPTCSILSSGLQDSIRIHSDIHDRIYAISIIPNEYQGQCDKKQAQQVVSQANGFKSKVSIHLGEEGLKTKPYVPVKQDEEESRSWISKYVC